MKNIIIAGPGRSGKTNISLRLRELGYTHYKMDSVKRGIDNNFYEGFKPYYMISDKMCHLIGTMIREIYTDIVKDKECYVIDTCHIYPKDIYKEELIDTVIIFIGYSNISIEDKFNNIRKYDKDNIWTNKLSDDELFEYVKDGIKFSREIEDECKKFNINFFDMSYDYDKGIESVIEYIKSVI